MVIEQKTDISRRYEGKMNEPIVSKEQIFNVVINPAARPAVTKTEQIREARDAANNRRRAAFADYTDVVTEIRVTGDLSLVAGYLAEAKR